MPTVIRVDLRSAPPYWKLMQRDPDRVVKQYSGATGGERISTSARGLASSTLAEARAAILDDLAAERESITESIRGDNAGPQLIPRDAPIEMGHYDLLVYVLDKDTSLFAEHRAKLRRIAALEYQYAKDIQAADQVLYDASTAAVADGSWLWTNGYRFVAKMEHDYLSRMAADRFNAGLRAVGKTTWLYGLDYPQHVFRGDTIWL